MTTTCNLPFVGGELASFDPLNSQCFETTGGGTFDPAFARCSIAVTTNSSGCTSPKWAVQSTFFFHEMINIVNQNNWWGGLRTLQFYDNVGTVVFAMTSAESGGSALVALTFYTLQSGVLTSVGSFSIGSGSSTILDIELVGNSLAGQLQVFVNGTQRIGVAGLNHSGFAGVAQVFLGGSPGLNNYACHSEVICDSVSHIGDRLRTYPIDTLSAVNTGWTGGVANVDEIVLSDTTFVYAASASLTSTYYPAGFSLGTYNVLAVAVGARANVQSGSGPQNLQLVLRTAGTNYNSSSIGLAVGYQACTHSWTTNPNTSAAWTTSAAQAIEGGQESIT